MRRVKTLAPALLWVIWLVLALLAFRLAADLGAWYPTASLRYHTPIDENAAQAARQYAAGQKGKVGGEHGSLWPTFWSAANETLHSDLNEVEAPSLYFSGNAALVWPAKFLAGNYPGPADEVGCAVSRQLAWQLWGSQQVVGNTVRIGGEEFIVRGVFEGNSPLALASRGDRPHPAGWQAVELEGEAKGNLRAEARQFAQSAGLGEPDTLLTGPALSGVAAAVVLLPSLVLLAFALVRLGNLAARRQGSWRSVIAFALLLMLALALPGLLELLPASLLPNRWSDFSFWSLLASDAVARVGEFFAMWPLEKDVEAKWLLVRLAAVLAGMVALLWPLCRRLVDKTRPAFHTETVARQEKPSAQLAEGANRYGNYPAAGETARLP